MKRDWRDARRKVVDEGRCRNCRTTRNLEAAHLIPRSRIPGEEAMDSRNVIPLCTYCHSAQHAGKLEILPLLTRVEEEFIVHLVGIEEARKRMIREAA